MTSSWQHFSRFKLFRYSKSVSVWVKSNSLWHCTQNCTVYVWRTRSPAVLKKHCEFCLMESLLFLKWFLDGVRKEEDKETAQSGSLNLAKPVLIWCHAVLSFVDEKSHEFTTNTNSEIKVTQRSFTYTETIIETLQI